MYLLTWYEERSVLEASIGGRTDAAELRVLGEEMIAMIEDEKVATFNVVLDQSKAKGLDSRCLAEIHTIKDLCLKFGAIQIMSVIDDERARATQMTARLQNVMEGTETFVADADWDQFSKIIPFSPNASQVGRRNRPLAEGHGRDTHFLKVA